MSGLYLYGLLAPGRTPPTADLAALDGVTGPVTALETPAACVLVSSHDGGEILPTRRSLMRHLRVLEALMAFGPLLPMRFGLVAESSAEVTALVDGRRDEIRREFDRLADRVEIGVRVTGDREAAIATLLTEETGLVRARDRLAAGGRASQMDRIALGRQVGEALAGRREACERALVSALEPVAVEMVARPAESDVDLLRVDVLVERSDLTALEAALSAAAASLPFHPGRLPAMKLIGPAPPSSFVRLSLARARSSELG